MKVFIEIIWFAVFIVSGYVAVNAALYLGESKGIFLSGLGGLVVFIICVFALASVVWFVTDRVMPKQSEGIFSSDDLGAQFVSKKGVDSFLWDDIRKIEITTNDKGPLEEDMFWRFYDGVNQKVISIPQGIKKDKSIKKAVKNRFHSSDELKIDMAMATCSNKQFSIWQSMDYAESEFLHQMTNDASEGLGLKHRSVEQNNWVALFIVILALASYGGYYLFNQFNPETTLWDGLKEHSVEFFAVNLIGIMAVYLLSAFNLNQFCKRHAEIDGLEALEALKPVVRRCMWLALFTIVLIVLCFGFLAMAADYFGGKVGLITGTVLTGTSVVFSQWYDPQEKAFKQIPCTDPNLELEVQAIFNSWEKNLLPKF